MTEPRPDEDVLASDCSVDFPEASVRVQVKCTSQWKIGGRGLTWAVEDNWVRKWDQFIVPVYFVVVIVPEDQDQWLRQDGDGTFHRTAAFWVRLIPGMIGDSIKVPKSQRLTVQTIPLWHSHLLDLFTPGGNHE